METVGQRIHRLRVERGLSQRELALLAGKGASYAYISRIEIDARTPSVKALRKLARALDVTAHYIEFGEEDPAETMLTALTARVERLRLELSIERRRRRRVPA